MEQVRSNNIRYKLLYVHLRNLFQYVHKHLSFNYFHFKDICTAISKKERISQWIHSRILYTGNIRDFFNDGTLLCSLINSAIPGACTNPDRHWKKPPIHGQALAYKYLGIVPVSFLTHFYLFIVLSLHLNKIIRIHFYFILFLFQLFTESDFDKPLMTQMQEKKFIDYLTQIQQAMCKISIPQHNELKFTSNYLARGMGLIAGDEKRKNTFFVYRNTTITFVDNDNNIFISIRGPYNSYGSTTIQSFINNNNNDQINKNNRKNKKTKGATSHSNTNNNKPFFKALQLNTLINNKLQDKNEIPIRIAFEINRAKIIYIPESAGIYEICLITNGAHLMGSPYNVQILENTTGIVDNFNDDNNDTTQKNNVIKKRVISRTINFVDEEISYEEYENYKRSCMEKVIREHEMLVEKERRDSSIVEDFKTIIDNDDNIDKINVNDSVVEDVNNVTSEENKNEIENEVNIEEYEFVSSNDDESEGGGRKITEIIKQEYEAIDQENHSQDGNNNNVNKSLSAVDVLRNEIQLKKMNFLNSTLSDNESIISASEIIENNLKFCENYDKFANNDNNSNNDDDNKDTTSYLETSPICNNHIVQEVVDSNTTNNEDVVNSDVFPHPTTKDVIRTVEEKRKNLKKVQHLNCTQNEISLNVTSSLDDAIEQTTDNRTTLVVGTTDECISNTDDNCMRILDVLDCLKGDNSYNYITCSLPNLSNNEDNVIKDNYRIRSHSLDVNEICSIRTAYKERKAYWLKLLNENNELQRNDVNNIEKISEEGCKRKITMRARRRRTMTLPIKMKLINSTFSYSANDVSHAKEKSTPYTKYENLTFPSIEERKAIFSSENSINDNNYNNNNKMKTEDNSNTDCSSSVSSSSKGNLIN